MCEKVRDDAVLKLVNLSREIYRRKCKTRLISAP